MVNWDDPQVQRVAVAAFGQLNVFVLGAYLWYFILSLADVEFGLLLGKMRFGLAHVPYFVARYSQLLALVLFSVTTNAHVRVWGCNSAVMIRASTCSGNIALAAASANLGFRAIMIWKDKLYVVLFLAFASFIHFMYAIFLGIRGIVKHHNPDGSCVLLTDTVRTELRALYLLTMSLDLLILLLTTFGLRRHQIPRTDRRSRIADVLFQQGVLYALVSTMTSIPMAVFMSPSINHTLSILFSVPSSTISIIASSASVAALFNAKECTQHGTGNCQCTSGPWRGDGMITNSGQVLSTCLCPPTLASAVSAVELEDVSVAKATRQ